MYIMSTLAGGGIMQFPVSKIYKQYDFEVTGASYAGNPRNNTMMYITTKVAHLIENLYGHKECLCFVDEYIQVPQEIDQSNAIIRCKNPTYTYAKLATEIEREIHKEELKQGYTLTGGGYYIGKNVRIGENAYVEPNVVIGHNVKIGNNATILAGSVIKRAEIGNDFVCNENAVIGDYGFTMAEDNEGNKFRIPTLGRVIIGNHVEVGACDDIAAGACGDTILEDYVKVDALVHVGHEAHVHKNAEIVTGTVVGGFSEIGEQSFLGINCSIRNRLILGDNCIIGMGAVVTKSVESGVVMAGNPAKLFERKK